MKIKIPHILLGLYIVQFIALGINPYSRDVWIVENLPIMLIVLFLAVTYRRFSFSNTSYIFMSVLVFMHPSVGIIPLRECHLVL